MPDRWLDVSVRKVLRPTTSIQVFFLGFPVSWKQMLRWFPNIQDVTTCFSCSPPDVNVNFSSTVSSTCICVQNHCHRAKAQLQLNKYYYIIKNRRLTVRGIAEQVNTDRETVRKILLEDLDMRKVYTKMVPKELTEEQERTFLVVSRALPSWM